MKERILVVDNDPSVLEAWKTRLERGGYEVFTAKSPDEAKELLKKEQIHLAVIDIRLINNKDEKDVSGIDLLRMIKKEFPEVIITTASASTSTKNIIEIRKLGAFYHSDKTDPNILMKEITEALKTKNSIC